MSDDNKIQVLYLKAKGLKDQKKYAEAKKSLLNGIKLSKKTKNIDAELAGKQLLGYLLIETNDINTGVDYLIEFLNYIEPKNIPEVEGPMLTNITTQLISIYRGGQSNLDKILGYTKRAVAIFSKMIIRPGQEQYIWLCRMKILASFNHAFGLYQMGEPQYGINILEEALELAKKINANDLIEGCQAQIKHLSS